MVWWGGGSVPGRPHMVLLGYTGSGCSCEWDRLGSRVPILGGGGAGGRERG